MGPEETGSGEEREVEERVTADDFLQPGDEDFNEETLNESVEETLQRTRAAITPEASEDRKGHESTRDKNKAEAARADQQATRTGDNTRSDKPDKGGQPGGGRQQLEPPRRVSAEAREWFQKAAPEAQKEFTKIVRDLENGQHQRLREIAEYRKVVEPIFQTIEPWRQEWAAKGIGVPQGVALLAKTHGRMLANPDHELARLIIDNIGDPEQLETKLKAINQHIRAWQEDPSYFTRPVPTRAGDGARNGHSGYATQIQDLRNQVNALTNENNQARAKAIADEVRKLRGEVDANGNSLYEHIESAPFLAYAGPLLAEKMTPPRGPDGRFTGPPKSHKEAYKELYDEWVQKVGIGRFTPGATSPQLNGTQSQQTRTRSEPISMRPRSAPAGGVPQQQSNDPSKYLNESVEETMARIRIQGA